jgi:hypothetical protein
MNVYVSAQTHARSDVLAALTRARVPGAVHGPERLFAPAAGDVLQLQRREQLVDREATRGRVAGRGAPARARAPRRHRAAAARHHQPCAQLP